MKYEKEIKWIVEMEKIGKEKGEECDFFAFYIQL
jgi:hypothetical protein